MVMILVLKVESPKLIDVNMYYYLWIQLLIHAAYT